MKVWLPIAVKSPGVVETEPGVVTEEPVLASPFSSSYGSVTCTGLGSQDRIRKTDFVNLEI